MIYNFEYDFNDKVIGVEVDYDVETLSNKFGVEHDSNIYDDVTIYGIESDDDEFNRLLSKVEYWNNIEAWILARKYDELVENFKDNY